MDVSQYLADSPPTVVPLVIKPHFEALTDEQKLYAHHISKYVKVNVTSLFFLEASNSIFLHDNCRCVLVFESYIYCRVVEPQRISLFISA